MQRIIQSRLESSSNMGIDVYDDKRAAPHRHLEIPSRIIQKGISPNESQ